MKITMQDAIQEIKNFRQYVLEDFTGYMKEHGVEDIPALLKVLNGYGASSKTHEVRQATQDLVQELSSLSEPNLFNVIDAMSNVLPHLDEDLGQKERDVQFWDYCDEVQALYERVQDTEPSKIDIDAICRTIEAIGNKYNEVTKEYGQALVPILRDRGNDKQGLLSLIGNAYQVVRDDVTKRNGLDVDGNIQVGQEKENHLDMESVRDYSEEISNMGMYILNMDVGRRGMPQIIQKVRERGDAYNTFTQRVSRRIVKRLEQILADDGYSDREVQMAAMGILMGSAQGISSQGDDE